MLGPMLHLIIHQVDILGEESDHDTLSGALIEHTPPVRMSNTYLLYV